MQDGLDDFGAYGVAHAWAEAGVAFRAHDGVQEAALFAQMVEQADQKRHGLFADAVTQHVAQLKPLHLRLEALEVAHDVFLKRRKQAVFVAEVVVERASVQVRARAQIACVEVRQPRSSISSTSASLSAHFERVMRLSSVAAVSSAIRPLSHKLPSDARNATGKPGPPRDLSSFGTTRPIMYRLFNSVIVPSAPSGINESATLRKATVTSPYI